MELVNPIVRRWCREAAEDPEAFWARAARQLPWFRLWDRVFEWDPPTFRWFVGAQTNLSYNCLDRHVAAGRGGHRALIALNERGERTVMPAVDVCTHGPQRAHDARHRPLPQRDVAGQHRQERPGRKICPLFYGQGKAGTGTPKKAYAYCCGSSPSCRWCGR